MLKGTWRLAAGAAAAGTGVIAVACSSGSNAGGFSTSSPGVDSGSSVDAAEDSAFGGMGEAEAAASVTSALFVNAMPSGVSGTAEGYSDGSFRFCWSTPGSLILGQPSEDGGGPFPFPTAPMPASNFPGVAIGSAVLMPDASSLVGTVTIYAIRSLLLENTAHPQDPCGDLIGESSTDLESNVDYFTLGPVIVKPGVANVIVVGGCAAEIYAPGANTQVCGSSWDPELGNLHAEVLTAAAAEGGGSGLPIQVAQLSTGLAQLLADAGTANLSLAALDPDGGSTTILQKIASVSAEGQILPDAALPLPLDGSLPSYGDLGLRLDLPGQDAGARTFFLTLAQAQQLVDPTVDPRVYYGGQGTYLIGIVGDPNGVPPFATTPEGGSYDGTGLHFLVVQAQPNPL